jgi:hypothetical protein
MNINKEISPQVYNYLYNISDLEFEFLQNESGYSKDVDGHVKLFKYNNLD